MISLRKLFLADPEAYKRVIISAPQRTLLDLIRLEFDGIGSSHAAEILDISVQSASARLKILFEKGYLDREEIASASGGIEFIYKISNSEK